MSLPLNGTWTTGAPMPTGRNHGVCAVVGDKIYYACGSMDYPATNNGITGILEIYDTKNDAWHSGTSAPKGGWGPGFAILDKKIYVVGGRSTAKTDSNIIQIYDTTTDIWELSQYTLPTARRGLKCCILNRKLYCIGGRIGETTYTNICEILDLATGTWTTGKPMPDGRAWGSCIPYNNYIFWFSGLKESNLSIDSHILKYNTIADEWEKNNDFSFECGAYGYAYDRNFVYCLGGNSNSTITSRLYAINIANGNLSLMPNMSITCQGIECAIVNGKLYAFGGFLTNSTVRNTTEIYPAEESIPPPTDKCCCTEVELKIKTCSCNTELLKDLNAVLEKDGLKGCVTSGCKK